MTEHIQVEDLSGVRVIRMNRAERKNALNHAMYEVMAHALVSAQADASIRVVMLTGSGDSFTAGNDMGGFVNRPPNLQADELPPVQKFLHGVLTAEKPLIAAVNGVAVGIGVTMLLHCDLVYAAESAVFSAPFVDLGLVPEAASSLLLPGIVGQRKATEMFLLGEKFNADQAKQCELVNAVFGDADLEAKAMDKAMLLTKKPPQALRQTKALMKRNVSEAAQRMKDESELFAKGLAGDEFKEASSAFLEKRKPDFSRFQ